MSSYTAPTGYRHTLPITIRFADMDAMGHVNNATYLTYFESARIAYALEIFRLGDVAQLGMILAKMTVEYKLPLTLGDEIVVYTRCSRLGTKSFDLEAQILRFQAGKTQVAATGQAVMVTYDYASEQTVAVPAAWRQHLLAYEPGLAQP